MEKTSTVQYQRDEQVAHLPGQCVYRAVRHASRGEYPRVEHLDNLKPHKGKYSRRSNAKRANWMKERLFKSQK